MVQEIEQLRDEVRCRAAMDLAEIAIDESVTREGVSRCARAAHDFEDAVHAILHEPWIPKTIQQITSCLMAISENIRVTQSAIDAALEVLDSRPDDVFRVWMACNFRTLLETQREVLMDTAMKLMPPSPYAN